MNNPQHGRRVRVLVAAGAVAAAALAACGTTAPPAVPSPLSAVTSALARTAAESYTFSLDSTTLAAGKELNKKLNSGVISGTFDPRHGLGTEVLTQHSSQHSARAQIRFIGTYLYTWVSPGSGMGTLSKPWDKSRSAIAAAGRMPPGDLYGFVSDQPVSPDELVVVLRSAGAAVHDSGPVSGPGWTGGKYTFTARLYDGKESVSGTAYVDRQGRVRRLTTITTEEPRPAYARNAKNVVSLVTDRELTFGHFGAPVLVSAPPPSQTVYTSGRPYWGFYF